MCFSTIVEGNAMTEPRVQHVVGKDHSGHTRLTSTEGCTQIVDTQMQALKVIAAKEKCKKKTVKYVYVCCMLYVVLKFNLPRSESFRAYLVAIAFCNSITEHTILLGNSQLSELRALEVGPLTH